LGAAWLRLDLLPVAAQPPLREKFRQYMDARLAFYHKLSDFESDWAEQARTTASQTEIWKAAVAACRDSSSTPATMLLPALNQMIDITTTRTAAVGTHAPLVIYVMLGLLAGYGLATGKARNWFHGSAFAVIMTLAIYVILDFEFPRLGLIRLNAFDQVLVDVRQTMNP
jgi:hypothetical protein